MIIRYNKLDMPLVLPKQTLSELEEATPFEPPRQRCSNVESVSQDKDRAIQREVIIHTPPNQGMVHLQLPVVLYECERLIQHGYVLSYDDFVDKDSIQLSSIYDSIVGGLNVPDTDGLVGGLLKLYIERQFPNGLFYPNQEHIYMCMDDELMFTSALSQLPCNVKDILFWILFTIRPFLKANPKANCKIISRFLVADTLDRELYATEASAIRSLLRIAAQEPSMLSRNRGTLHSTRQELSDTQVTQSMNSSHSKLNLAASFRNIWSMKKTN